MLAVTAAACGSDDPSGPDADAMPRSPGAYDRELSPGGQRYTLLIPSGYNARQPTPLVLSLHYGGSVLPYYGRPLLEVLVGPALEDIGAIIVAPEATVQGWDNEESEQQVLELIRSIKANYMIDEARTLVTGFSMGGRGTWYMAARHPDLFRAAIPISGRPEENATEVDWQVPLLVIHSVADEVIPFGPVESTVRALKGADVRIDLIVVQNVGHYDIQLYVEPLRAAVPWIRRAWEE
ncbi:MAG: prolyl oligopeptidase family serine peptidase [Gemmatimonadota bacterium]|nr:prolyl oligopeptidase family serine peptidase [Gemmatimonadota bacterium]